MGKAKNTNKANEDKQQLLRLLPSVETTLLELDSFSDSGTYSHEFVAFTARKHIDRLRAVIAAGRYTGNKTRDEIAARILDTIKKDLHNRTEGNLLPVINATGIVLHTGLGRAPLSASAAGSVRKVLRDYSLLEVNRESGNRGKREDFLEDTLCFLSGAEAATVVNNNAAAVLISLNTLAKGREVIVSRGELIEIGGSFRMPEIMESSGAVMKEIGTTNKTKLSDYKKAINQDTGAILIAHTSNFKVMGFQESVPINDIVKLASTHSVPVIYDLGGGVLFDLRKIGLPYEPVAADAVKQGADIVTFSGDKVFGGSQAGIIVGKKPYINAIKSNPIARAVRCDKMTLAALDGTIKAYTRGFRGFKSLPAMKLMTDKPDAVLRKAEILISKIRQFPEKKLTVLIEESGAEAGSGTLPLEKIPSWAVTLKSRNLRPEKIAYLLRTSTPPVFGYIKNDKIYLDMRTVFKRQISDLAAAINKLDS